MTDGHFGSVALSNQAKNGLPDTQFFRRVLYELETQKISTLLDRISTCS